ncbi:alpha/beta-hydrolase [Lophium mytilinum]|uniref:Alpha/beta-hydrolase n=1 Tax=Lophium mytilinum TaxID=390894 RepID=A0A6A6RED0_9PEZI|nr:alpha/beta-hydrolase [Lophium mytilinum]
MDATGAYHRITVCLSAVSGIWILGMLLCSIPWFQRQMLYLHWVKIWWGFKLDRPETFGFLKSQVAPFRIPTNDGERLYAWLIAPLGIYARHVESFQKEKAGPFADVKERLAFQLLAQDPEARLVIYFHGNTATIGQGRRTEEYRVLSSGASDKIFILTFDYRGFGHSTGTPTEAGCVNDAIAVLDWALNEAHIPADRIVLLGHSLGTAVASAAAQYAINLDPPSQIAGVVICAGFSDAKNAFLSYSVGGVLPVFAPLKLMPWLSAWLGRRVKDTWKSADRLAEVVQKSRKIRMTMVHATGDIVMPFHQSNELFYRIVESVSGHKVTRTEIDKMKESIDLGDGGVVDSWIDGERIIRKEIVYHGG